jgi:hypothetical protein
LNGIMDCILHIGIGKAGSSTIQGALQQGRAGLLARGILYPDDLLPRGRRGGDNHKCLAVAAMDAARTNVVLKQHGILNARGRDAFDTQVMQLYRNQVAAAKGAVCLLSAEHFWSVLGSGREIARLAGLTRQIGLNIGRIIIYLRRQSDWFESLQSQRLREGHVRVENDASAILASLSARQLDYAAVVAQWQDAFPAATMVPRLFEKGDFAGGSLLSDFWDAAGLDGAGIAAPQDRNVSAMSNLGMNALIAANRDVPALLDNGALNLARKDIAAFIATRMPGRVRVLGNAAMARIDERYAASNEALRRRYFPTRTGLFPAAVRAEDIETFTPVADKDFTALMTLFTDLWKERAAEQIAALLAKSP